MAHVIGTDGKDTIRVGFASAGVVPPTGTTNAADTVVARAGNDSVDGGGGNDTINGGAGNDTLNGGAGKDTVFGNEGNDVVRLGAGHDLFVWNPGDGSDTVNGDAGSDTHQFNGSDGDEIFTIRNDGAKIELLRNVGDIDMDLRNFERIELVAKGGNDRIDASALSNPVALSIDGGAGNDTINGSANADTINAGTGNDILNGNAGKDILNGGAGNDTLVGGAGKDTLTGGAGADKFKFFKGDTGFGKANADVITDFSRPQADKIDLTATNVTKFVADELHPGHGEVSSFFSGDDTVVRFNDGGFHDIVLDDLHLAMNVHDFLV